MSETETYPSASGKNSGKTLSSQTPPDITGAELRLSPQRTDLFKRTLAIRQAIGRVSGDLTKMVRDMREKGD